MVVAVAPLNRSEAFTVAALLVGAFRHYGYGLAPAHLQGVAAKGLGGLALLACIAAFWLVAPRAKWTAAVLLWWAWEELQVSLCSFAYMAEPWPVAQGQSICSAKAGFDIGAIGILVVALLAFRVIPVRSSRSSQ